MSERNTKKYELRDGSGRTLYIGITKDLERREAEHRQDGKEFAEMVQVGRATTPEAAANWEEMAIQDYKDNHHGHRPKYNQNDHGK